MELAPYGAGTADPTKKAIQVVLKFLLSPSLALFWIAGTVLWRFFLFSLISLAFVPACRNCVFAE
ncbi:hypothetical protein A200_07949 [Parascardovia denticolens IPLA 20019]|nr:hypothetical protein A200_07949 [Parascardovia denticolens IPLA 20019]